MSDLVDVTLLLEADPSLTPVQSQRLLDAVNGQVRRVAPCLLDPDAPGRAEAILIIVGALRAFAEAPPPPWLESETTGPFSAHFRALESRLVLSPADEATLRALCSGAVVTPGLSRGSFPPPGPVERIFNPPVRLW